MYFAVELYVTSEENYNGIVSMNWVNGLELKLSLEEWLHDFKIKGVRNEYLKLWTSCTDDFSNQCITDYVLQKMEYVMEYGEEYDDYYGNGTVSYNYFEDNNCTNLCLPGRYTLVMGQ